MFGGFMRGIVGTALTGIAVILFFILLGNHVSIGVAFLIAGGAWVIGLYLRYVSRQTVRMRN